MTEDRDLKAARKARMVGAVMAVTMVLWIGATFIGGKLGLPPRYAFLFDFAALAAFIWALYVTFQIWQARRNG